MEREGESECNTTLALAIGGGGYTPGNSRWGGAASFDSEPPVKFHGLFPLPLCAKKEEEDREEEEELQTKRYASGGSRKSKSSLDPEEEDGGGGQDSARKKLKLTKEQVTLLDDCFRKHHTLNNMQKQDLADRLSIQPRQVEVWFQNRRARTKLKQIEVDYELVKRCCESLNDENKRLKKELQELRSAGSPAGSPLYMQQLLKATTLTICPFCQRVAATGAATRAAAAAATAVESMKSSATTGVLRFKNN